MQPVRQGKGLFEKIRPLPALFQGAGIERRDPRSEKVELVIHLHIKRNLYVQDRSDF